MTDERRLTWGIGLTIISVVVGASVLIWLTISARFDDTVTRIDDTKASVENVDRRVSGQITALASEIRGFSSEQRIQFGKLAESQAKMIGAFEGVASRMERLANKQDANFEKVATTQVNLTNALNRLVSFGHRLEEAERSQRDTITSINALTVEVSELTQRLGNIPVGFVTMHKGDIKEAIDSAFIKYQVIKNVK